MEVGGIKIQEPFQLKYWPHSTYDDHLNGGSNSYDTSQNFDLSASGWANAHLAHHILTGRLDNLHGKLAQTGLEKYPGIDLYSKLVQQLSGNPNAFEIKCFRSQREGYIEFTVPVTRIEGDYSLNNYTASLTPYPPIQHDIYHGIDSAKLESQMQEIDWHKDKQLFIFQEDQEPALTPTVALIQEQIGQISQDRAGAAVADSLMLRYWPGTTFFEDLIPESTWDYLDSLPKRVEQFAVEVEAKSAFNLLCGRAILDTTRKARSLDQGEWIRLDLTEKDEEGRYPLIPIKGFTEPELKARLDRLPIDNVHYYSIGNALERGDLLPVALSDGRKVMLEASPEERTIHIYTPDMRPIYANLTLDPDWRPLLPETKGLPEERQKKAQTGQTKPFPKTSWEKPQKGKHLWSGNWPFQTILVRLLTGNSLGS